MEILFQSSDPKKTILKVSSFYNKYLECDFLNLFYHLH